jgi:hypothetical protein
MTKKLSPTLPRWVCRDEADQEWLTQWTIAELRAYYAEVNEEHLLADPAAIEAMFAEADQSFMESARAKAAVDEAIETESFAPLDSLPDKLTRAALKELFLRACAAKKKRKRKRGRGKGEFRSTDRSPDLLFKLELAAGDVEIIRKEIWKEKLGKMNRGEHSPPEARDIAAKYRGVTRKQLDNYMNEKPLHTLVYSITSHGLLKEKRGR